MKKLLFLLAIPAITFLASCGGDGDSEVPKPTITFETGTDLISADKSVEINTDAEFKVVCVSNDKKLKNVSMSLATNGGTSGKVKDSIVNAKTATVSFKSKVTGKVGDVLTYTFTVTDDNGETASKAINVTIAPKTEALSPVSAQKVSNVIGPDPGAYDLNTSLEKVSGDPIGVKDILDLTTTTTFAKSWGSGHGLTKYAVITQTDYDNTTTTTSLLALWNSKSASATSTITNIAKNTYYIIKSNQDGVDFDLYKLKVTDVVDATGNNDYIEFTYWKKP